MQPLDKTLRNQLERTVKDARDIAEAAARAALEQLGVGEAAPFAHLTNDERELRRKLRVHGRQLGDCLNGGKVQSMDRLVEEVAYEHWHRMLFARFLAENDLLMYPDPDSPVAVTLEECGDLAADEGAQNGWELASRFAARMLPQIFRVDSPVFQLMLPPEYQHKLERLVADLPIDVFTASDSLGWVYQFWQAKKKDEVNASEVKIGARELPAVTQLFTEPYMVSFLLDNSLGAWWAARRLSESDLKNAVSEEELRAKAALPGVPLEYLRFVRVPSPLAGEGQGEGEWVPAAGTFDGWPERLSDLKTLDPCCGSGHFLVATFLMLVPMRMEMEGFSARNAVDAVLRENIHGLEIDQRCVELAAFALALTAWRYPGAGGYRPLPEMQVACSGLAVSTKREDWVALAHGDRELQGGLDRLYDLFLNAPVLGSLLAPSTIKSDLFASGYQQMAQLLAKALQSEQTDEQREAAVAAQGLSKAANLLGAKYHLIITNVPYLSFKRMGAELKKYIADNYPNSKGDLANVFLERCVNLTFNAGVAQLVMTQNWLFLSSYKKQRELLLREMQWKMLVKLGGGAEAFDRGPGNITNICMIFIERSAPIKESAFGILDVTEARTPDKKACMLRITLPTCVNQVSQLKNPDARIASGTRTTDLLENYAICPRGVVSGDGERWVRRFWEITKTGSDMRYFQGTIERSELISGRDKVIDWSSEGKGMLRPGRDNLALGKKGVNISLIGRLPATFYSGEFYDQTTASVVPKNQNHVVALYCYCNSSEFYKNVRDIDQKLNVTPATLIKIPFDLAHWTRIADEAFPNGLPKPGSDDPTQWIFHGHPCGSVIWDEEKKWMAHGLLRADTTVLQVSIARMLGYRWPAELDNEMELSDEARDWVKKSEALLPLTDDDGLLCIPPVRGEASAADRLLNMLAVAYGDSWSNDILSELLKQVDHAGKTLETWLREKFFAQHCKLFQHRPFIWHIWDGLRDGFAALVNYHKLDRKNLETLIYTYLGDWISRQKQDKANGVDGAQEKLDAAENLKKRLELILEGEEPYDIFVRWKPIEKQPMGWEPDLNDGVRLNIRPFVTAQVLRFSKKPQLNISWDKDRGKDVESAPWYHLFNGDRINDHHLSLAEKRAAREVRNKEKS